MTFCSGLVTYDKSGLMEDGVGAPLRIECFQLSGDSIMLAHKQRVHRCKSQIFVNSTKRMRIKKNTK